jgi:GNAT superfamily N-acetyltransferase
MPNKLELMELQAKALFTHDSEFLIRNINDPDSKPAPRFFLGRTPEGDVLRFRYDLPQEFIKRLTELLEKEPGSCDLTRDAALLEKIKEILGEHQEVQKVHEGPAYKLPRGNHFPKDVIRITQENVHLLKNSFDYMLTELPYWEPCFVKFADGNAASICFSSRIADASHEAGVETLPPFRGKGYAAEAVAAWAEAIYEMGKIPTYSTSWENTASQAVDRKLKCELYGVDLSVY